jgi:hypothetical protein
MTKCDCCLDVGKVPSILGTPRPCSRCNGEEFRRWYEEMLKRTMEKPAAEPEQVAR